MARQCWAGSTDFLFRSDPIKATEAETTKDSDGDYFEAYEALVEQCSTMDAMRST